MSYLLQSLSTKNDIDHIIRSTEDLIVALRFGQSTDLPCLQLDHIVRLNYLESNEVATRLTTLLS
jgi:hypothetical protein